MMLAYNMADLEAVRAFLPMSYPADDSFRQGGYVQLDSCTWFSEGLLSGDAAGADRAYLDGSGVYSVSDAYQRTPAATVGRAAQGRPRIGPGEVST